MGIAGRSPQQHIGPASEALAGYVKLASVAEAKAGTNQTKAVTPEGLQESVDVIGNQTVKAQFFATISAGTTTGTISKPAGGGADVAFVMDEWGTDADALLSTLENGKPTFSTPTTALGVAITTTFNTAGEYSFSGTPSPANDIALIYVYKCYLTNLDPDEVLFESELISHSHSLLSNLDADDHTQYHNDTRGDVRYYKKTELNSGTLGSSGSSLIGINTINGDVPNLQMFVDGTQSSQVYSGGVVTKNAALDGTIDISAMTGYIKREADNEAMDMGSFQIAEAVGASLSSGINYICVDWNNDTPIFTYLTSLPNHSTVFPFAQVYKDANDHLHIIQGGHNFLGLPWKVFERFYNVEGLVRASGLLTSAGSTHTHIDVSAGIFYQGLARFNFAAFDGDLKHEVDRVASSSTIVLDSGYGDLTTTYIHGLEIYLDGSGEAGNNDAFHVQSSSYSGGETTITVEGTPLTISAGDTGHVHPHTFTYWHYRLFDTTWVETNQAGQHVAIHIDTAYYNDITDADNGDELKAYTAQRYGVAWVYASSGEDSRVHVLYGQGDYTAAQAAEAAAPSSVPDILGKMGFLIAKIVFQTGDATLNNNLIFYPWTSTIATTGAADHGGLAGLADDDHVQYLLAAGTRELAGNWDVGELYDIELPQIILTPRSAALRAVKGAMFFDSDDDGVYIVHFGSLTKEKEMAETWKKMAFEDDVLLKSVFNAQSIVMATDDDTPIVLEVAEQEVIGRLTGGTIDGITLGIADNNVVQVDGSPNANEHAIFTAAGLDGKTDAELLALLSGDAGAAFDWNLQQIQNFLIHIVADDTAKTNLSNGSSVGMANNDAALYFCTEGE